MEGGDLLDRDEGPQHTFRPVLSVFAGTPTADEAWSMDGDEVVMVE